MISLLTHSNGLYFKNVYVYSKSLYHPKYKYLEKVLDFLVEYNQFKGSDDILQPNKAKFDSMFIFDDVACDNQT